MAIVLKTPEEIEEMRIAGHLAGEVLKMIREHVRVGVTTGELDDICHAYITEEQQAIPAPLNYRGFPKSICTSVNQVVCHGIPGNKILKKGDILNIDITVIKDGWHGDTSKMFLVGEPTVRARQLCEIAHKAMTTGIEMVRPGLHTYSKQRHVCHQINAGLTTDTTKLGLVDKIVLSVAEYISEKEHDLLFPVGYA